MAVAGAALLVTSIVGSTVAQSPSATAGLVDVTQAPSDQLAVLLLTADDLPAGLTQGGIGDVSAFPTDSADFQSNGGLGAVEQTWRAPVQGPAGCRPATRPRSGHPG